MNYATSRQLLLVLAALSAPATGCADDGALNDTDGGTDGSTDGGTDGSLDGGTERRNTTSSSSSSSTTSATTWTCTCAENDPEVNTFPLPDFDREGEVANAGGVTFQQLKDPNGVVYQLDTVGDELVARDAAKNIVADGEDLVDWTMEFLAGGATRTVKITSYDDKNVHSWKIGGGMMPVYGLAYYDAPSDLWRNVCPEYVAHPDEATVTVLAGETYDLDKKTVEPDMDSWITLACRNQAAYKMKRMSYGPHGEYDDEGHPSEPEQRQATLKMITADYCGDGTSFTQSGTSVYWKNDKQTVVAYDPAAAIEALWTEDGALCLGDTRVPSAAPAVALACDLPQCTPQMIAAGGYEWITRTVND